MTSSKQKKINIIGSLLIGVFIFICLFNEFVIGKNRAKEIIDNHNFTIGELISYQYPSSELPRTISYEYCVDGKKYDETISVGKRFDICKDFEKCRGRKYWVIYDKDNPKQCMIDLSTEIQNESVLIPPTDLSNFKYSTLKSYNLSFKKEKDCTNEYK